MQIHFTRKKGYPNATAVTERAYKREHNRHEFAWLDIMAARTSSYHYYANIPLACLPFPHAATLWM